MFPLCNTSTEALAGDLSGNVIDTSSQEVTGLTTDSDSRVLLANASQNATDVISDSTRNMQVPRETYSQEVPIQNLEDVTRITESCSVESREPLESSFAGSNCPRFAGYINLPCEYEFAGSNCSKFAG